MKKLLLGITLLFPLITFANPLTLANLSNCISKDVPNEDINMFLKYPVDSILDESLSTQLKLCAYSLAAASEKYTVAQIKNVILLMKEAKKLHYSSSDENFMNSLEDTLNGQNGFEKNKINLELLQEVMNLIRE